MHQTQARAVTILRIGIARGTKGRDRRLIPAKLPVDLAEGEPGGGEFRRDLDRLLEQVGGGGQIALQLQVARELEATVGNEIAGGQEQAQRHFV